MNFFTRFFILLFCLTFTYSVNSQTSTKFKAKDQIITANNYAQINYPGGVMYAITSIYGLDSTGKANAWAYYYFKPNVTDSGYVVNVAIVIVPIALGFSTPVLPGIFLRPLGTAFCDSDQSLTAAENAGGRDFRRTHTTVNITGAVNKLPAGPDTSRAYWNYIYTDSATSQTKVYTIDGTTCQVIPIGINNISTEVPADFKLYQNYPNPFNPETKIKFDVAGSSTNASNIKLKVFDITGKQVAELVNENLQPGTYEVDFNASGIASGIYFYSLEAQSFSVTKKMLIIK